MSRLPASSYTVCYTVRPAQRRGSRRRRRIRRRAAATGTTRDGELSTKCLGMSTAGHPRRRRRWQPCSRCCRGPCQRRTASLQKGSEAVRGWLGTRRCRMSHATPPDENWMMIGASALRAASRQVLTDEDVTQLTAGMAYRFSFACCSRSTSACRACAGLLSPPTPSSPSRTPLHQGSAWPVTTPGWTEGGRLGYDATAHSSTQGRPRSSANLRSGCGTVSGGSRRRACCASRDGQAPCSAAQAKLLQQAEARSGRAAADRRCACPRVRRSDGGRVGQSGGGGEREH